MRILLAFTCCVLVLLACKKHARPESAIVFPEELTTLPNDFKPKYRLEGVEDFGFKKQKKQVKSPAIRRMVVRIVIPRNTSEQELKMSHCHSMYFSMQRYGIIPIIVFGYWEGDSVKGPFSAGRLEWDGQVLLWEIRASTDKSLH